MTDVLLIMLVASLLFAGSHLKELTYLAQQSSYQIGGFSRHHFGRLLRFPDATTVLCSLIAFVAWVVPFDWLAEAVSIVVTGFALFQFVTWGKQSKSLKLPLVWTPRSKRLVATFVLCVVIELVICWLWIPGLLLIPAATATLTMGLSLVLTKPVEMYIQSGFKRKANQRLRQLHRLNQLRVVGITGSYGKTSTKFILGTILGVKHDVLVTPSSFNTPMGICKVINGELAAHHEVFVAEMGARHRGDIRELVKFVQPTYSMITAVGPAHLETMGSLENIAKTKFDLARGTADEGVVVVNGDNEQCVREAGTLDRDVLFYGSEFAPHLSAFSKDVHVKDRETVFTLVFPGDGEVSCRTKLLGKHNVMNIVGAALLARRMGLSLEEIEAGIVRIEPVEHRLQLIDPGNGVLVIDDAFNSNPEGAAMAIEVLGQFTHYRKWMVTPGMVEMGAQSAAIHQTLGRQMASVCDKVILVGKLNSAMMLKGLMEAGFPQDQVYIAGSLAEAQSMWQKELRPGDVLLLENDFPDHLEQASS